MRKLTHTWPHKGYFSPKIRALFFQFLKTGREDVPSLSPPLVTRQFCKLQLPTMSDSSMSSSETSLSSSDSLDSFSNFDKLKPYRSSRLEVFCKKSVLRNFTKFTGKYLCQSLIFSEVAGRSVNLVKKRL